MSTQNPETLTETEEVFLAYLENAPSIKAAAEAAGISKDQAYHIHSKLKGVILDRARDSLAAASLKAVATAVDMMDADASTEKGELRLAAAEKIMDRVGITKHTSVEVKIESESGVFLLPAKDILPPMPLSEDLSDDITPE